MRTTLTIDEDAAVQLQRLRRSKNRGLEAGVRRGGLSIFRVEMGKSSHRLPARMFSSCHHGVHKVMSIHQIFTMWIAFWGQMSTQVEQAMQDCLSIVVRSSGWLIAQQ